MYWKEYLIQTNPELSDFYIHLFNLVYWVGFGGHGIQNPFVKCRFHRFVNFLGRSGFESGLLFLRNIAFFRTLHLTFVFARPYYQHVRIDPGIILGFV